MIISLVEARKINKDVTQGDLDAFEQTVRALTNNSFQNFHVRFDIYKFDNSNEMFTFDDIEGVRIGDTIEINDSAYNDGLCTIKEIKQGSIVVDGEPFLTAHSVKDTTATLVKYPTDILKGVKGLLRYDSKMASKIGIKSETISRLSYTYYDVNASDNAEGYPKALLSFLDKYRKLRW